MSSHELYLAYNRIVDKFKNEQITSVCRNGHPFLSKEEIAQRTQGLNYKQMPIIDLSKIAIVSKAADGAEIKSLREATAERDAYRSQIEEESSEIFKKLSEDY